MSQPCPAPPGGGTGARPRVLRCPPSPRGPYQGRASDGRGHGSATLSHRWGIPKDSPVSPPSSPAASGQGRRLGLGPGPASPRSWGMWICKAGLPSPGKAEKCGTENPNWTEGPRSPSSASPQLSGWVCGCVGCSALALHQSPRETSPTCHCLWHPVKSRGCSSGAYAVGR